MKKGGTHANKGATVSFSRKKFESGHPTLFCWIIETPYSSDINLFYL